jgi:hypothetical protein
MNRRYRCRFQGARMTDQLLILAVQAARNIGITRRALRNRINAGLVRSVQVGP